ncbi:MAG: hypothetical protein JWO17_1613 [Actinomycetia bacterium]|nr:hypothetical protein [Actinomycetes bacterium]
MARKFRLLGALAVVLLAAVSATAASAGTGVSGIPTVVPQVVDDSSLKALTTTEGGASVLPTTRTIPHWFGQTLNPDNGITYGYNMVGSNPNSCSGAACSTTIQVDITPLIVNIDGMTFDGTSVLGATLASPQFATNDYGSTPAATAAGSFPYAPAFIRGAGGLLSQGDKGVQLQLQDATMRAQFNQVGKKSGYHLILQPNVLPAVTIDVPQNQGTLIQSGRGVVGANINISWWSSQIQNLESTADPTHLPLYLTNQVLLFIGSPGNCCVIGYHGTRAAGYGGGSANSNGNAVVQTFAWGSWVQPGFYSRANGGTDWALQDIHALSHEIAEWADDPFVNNTVQPWLTPTAPQYGCTGVLETGDPVVGIGFAIGSNTFEQGPNPNGTQSADGYYHPEDEALLPWFMRLPSNNTGSEANQSGVGGRYTLMGDLNPFAGFRQPATGC